MKRIELVGGFPSFYLNDNNDIIEEDYFFDEELDTKFEELFEQVSLCLLKNCVQ